MWTSSLVLAVHLPKKQYLYFLVIGHTAHYVQKTAAFFQSPFAIDCVPGRFLIYFFISHFLRPANSKKIFLHSLEVGYLNTVRKKVIIIIGSLEASV